MSTSSLKEPNVSQSKDVENGNDNSVKSCISKPVLNGNKCANKEQNVPSCCPGAVTNGNEAGNADVEYIDSENLVDLPDVDAALCTLVKRLDSKDWVMTCEALNNVRQLAMYHKERLQELLEPLVPLIVKSVKNPRSAVCKTALMTCADIFKVYGDLLVESIDPLLVQLFLKASQDKRFVCEAAEAALTSMTSWISPLLLLPRMQPYLKNRNPRVRAKASVCLSKSVPCLDVQGIREYGMDKLVQIAATQLSDQLPESREAARNLALELQVLYEKSQASTSDENEGEPSVSQDAESWEAFCQSKLSALSAQAILRVTSTTPKEGVTAAPKEGLDVDC
ncbi:ARM repeat superfamily protein [Zea mays]|uniref:ARM repeat superfamily protein n=1 Tax=Zea mays TaxID=4577 RepID=A0A1D6MBU5_MAIZE|nr:ARM repeat superfamily protein [Zea mays]